MQNRLHLTIYSLLPVVAGLFLLAMISACSKSDIEASGTLEVSQNEPVADASGGQVSLEILSNTSWKLGTIEAGWISAEETSGEGNGTLILHIAPNDAVASRSAEFFIVGKTGRSYQKITLTQLSADPEVHLESQSLEVVSRPRNHKLALTSNIPASGLDIEVLYEKQTETDWIIGARIENDSLRFQTALNPLKEKRIAHIVVSYGEAADEQDAQAWDKLQITQMDASNDLPPEDKDFAYVKALPLGDIEENIAVRGNIVSNGTSANFRKNTYILQDGNSSAIAFQPVEGLNLNRYDHIQLLLDGTKIETFKDAGMEYRLITGVSAANILEKKAGADFRPQVLSIGQLNEAHLLAMVTVKEVEFAISHGAFSNFHEYYPAQGYADYATRHYPTPLRDKQGDAVYLLTNREVPYRREAIPKGSGNVTGLVVKIKDSAYGDLGNYSLRQLSRADVDISSSRESGFTETLVEWEQQWSRGDFTDGTQHLPPTIGPKTAILNKDESDGFYYNTKVGGIYLIDKYRGDVDGSGTAVSKSTFNVNSWGTGRYWILDKLSTKGITTSLSLQIEGNSSTDWGPRDFAVEYALDGENWTRVSTFQLTGQISPGVSEFVIASGKMFTFKLPDELLNQENVQIRLVNISGTSVSGKQTTATATSRLMHFSIKYVK